MKALIVVPFALAILAVPSNKAEAIKPIKVVNSGGELYEKWQNAVERKCEGETDQILFAHILANPNMTENDVVKLRSMLLFSCMKFNNLAF